MIELHSTLSINNRINRLRLAYIKKEKYYYSEINILPSD